MDLHKLRDEAVGEVVEGISKLAVPEPQITDKDVSQIRSILMPGDVIVCRRNYEVSNEGEELLTKSFWGHAAIFMDWSDQALPVFEAVTKDGYRKVSLERLCLTKDSVGVGRANKLIWTPQQLETMEEQALKWLGLPYNFEMDWTLEGKLYCSQAVVKLLQIGDPSIVFKQTNLIGMEISPQNVWDSVTQLGVWGEKP